MKTIGTYHDLARFRNDINEQCKAHPTFAVFNKIKIASFLKYNKQRLDHMDKKFSALKLSYIEHDEQGNMKTYKDENGVEKFVYLNEEAATLFTEAYNELMNAQITIEY